MWCPSCRLLEGTFEAAGTVAMVCGPEVMMRFTVQALLEAGVDADRILVSLERNMQCAIKQCGHCQLGPYFVCADGPVMPYGLVAPWLRPRECDGDATPARRVEVRLVRRVPADAAELRGRAAARRRAIEIASFPEASAP